MMQVLERFTEGPSECSYLPDQQVTQQYEVVASLSPAEYEARMNQGWRKFGRFVFRPVCQACRECRPIRVPVARFAPDRSQARALKRNADLTVRIAPPIVDEARMALYTRYHQSQAARKGWPDHERDPLHYAMQFVYNPVPSLEISVWEGDNLRAIALNDITPNVVSGIYHYHDPDERERSLGTYTILQIFALARQLGKAYVYLGYYVADCGSMAYKNRFRPCEILGADGMWRELEWEVFTTETQSRRGNTEKRTDFGNSVRPIEKTACVGQGETKRNGKTGMIEAAKTKDSMEYLLQARYGADGPDVAGGGNATLHTLLAHKSVRHYADAPLPPGALETIVACAQSAATSSNLQTWSVVAVQESERKAQAAVLCGDQEFIRRAPLFLVFCADLSRLTTVSEQAGLPGEGLDYMEMFIMATVDASLAGQNAAVAAESLGLGICYVGGARNKPRELSALLELPPRAFAVFGMAVGVPAPEDMATVKPRLAQPAMLHLETYSTTANARYIVRYDATMNRFYESQRMTAQGEWTRRSAQRVASVESLTGRHILREVLQERGFGLK